MALAVYACDPARSRGRRHAEPPAPTRSDFQRDRDRVIHCSAFRRLVYKTQVFLNHEGDLFRTRLTHSLEVAQLGRSIARSLGLHEDLVEAIALSHDLGHTPFGHAGQDALNDCMADYGGFEHNLQSLRIVDRLEERYPDFDGLNLTFETREGILKHCANRNALLIEAEEPAYADGGGGVGRRFLDRSQPSLEAQLCNLADEIAYNAHDIDDGVRSGLITIEQLESVPLFQQYLAQTRTRHPHLCDAAQDRRLLYETIRQMLSAQVYDVIDATTAQLQVVAPGDVREVRAAPPLVQFSDPMRRASTELKQFLLRNLYRHAQVMATTNQARRIVRELFAAYMEAPQSMQPGFVARSEAARDDLDELQSRARVVADFIAGMTDRFAVREHERITGVRLLA
ncbi:deoxyguanosinetriphosphate triphosphohydrolase [Comamonadaceae bacterium G21597-S1]|nr:deoxyguanosinetriphosphate triphosphohydrolase [Comamonadaceae bacterium G21597-S1]